MSALAQRPGTGFFAGMRMLLQRWFLRRWSRMTETQQNSEGAAVMPASNDVLAAVAA